MSAESMRHAHAAGVAFAQSQLSSMMHAYIQKQAFPWDVYKLLSSTLDAMETLGKARAKELFPDDKE